MSTPAWTHDLRERWRAEAERRAERWPMDPLVPCLMQCADELEEEERIWQTEPLTLQEAAAESGYSADHIGRLVRSGDIPNKGASHAPRVHRGDLPRKPRPLSASDSPSHLTLTKEQIVRSVAPNGGSDG